MSLESDALNIVGILPLSRRHSMNQGQEGPLQAAQSQGLWFRATEGAVEALVPLCVQGKSVFCKETLPPGGWP